MFPLRYFMAFACILGNCFLYAQHPGNPRIDSLTIEVNKQKGDSNQVKTLSRLGSEFLNIGLLDTARLIFQQAIDLAEKIHFVRIDRNIHYSMGISYFYMGNNDEAIRHWEIAKTLAIEKNDRKMVPDIQVCLANVQQSIGNLPEALQIYFEVLKAFEQARDSDRMATILINIGVVHSQMENFDQSNASLLAGQLIADKMNLTSLQCNARFTTADNYSKTNDFETAEKIAMEGLRIAEKEQNLDALSQGHLSLGNAYSQQGKLIESIAEFEKSNSYLSQMGDIVTIGSNQGRLATLYTELSKPEQKATLQKLFNGQLSGALSAAKVLADSSMMILQQSGDIDGQKNLYFTLARISELEGNYKGAYGNYIRYKSLSDTLLNLERDKKITQTTMQYEFDKKDAATKALQDKKDVRQATLRNSIMAVLGGSLLVLGLVYRQRNRISTEKKRSDDLLLNILPAEVAEELKIKGSTDARQFDNTTVLFTDFVRFTEIAEKLSPTELVAEIHRCFVSFDDIMQKHGLEKIKTIGDSYMAACGLPQEHPDHAKLAVLAALDIRDFIRGYSHQRAEQHLPAFEIRIGLHSGPVVAGIVGVKKFQYDIWGDTVNTASRMESSGEAGKVQISQFTYDLVKDVPGLTFTDRGKQVVKGKGEMETWFVERA